MGAEPPSPGVGVGRGQRGQGCRGLRLSGEDADRKHGRPGVSPGPSEMVAGGGDPGQDGVRWSGLGVDLCVSP